MRPALFQRDSVSGCSSSLMSQPPRSRVDSRDAESLTKDQQPLDTLFAFAFYSIASID